MAGLNKVMLIGNLGRNPEMRYTPDGTPVTSFSLAVERSWKNSDGQDREAVEWFSIIAWRHLAEMCSQSLVKGGRVYVEGRLQTRSWEDEAGQRHFRTEVVANNVISLSGEMPGKDLEAPSEPEQGPVG